MKVSDFGKDIQRRADEFNLAKNYPEAEKLYDMLLTQNHDNPHLLATLGTLYIHDDRKRYGAAISFLERAASALKTSDVLCNLAVAYKFAEMHEKCKETFKRACEKNPSAGALANYGALFVGVNNPDEAVRLSDKAIALDPNCAMAHWNKGLALLEKGDFANGWDEHEWGLKSLIRIDRKIMDLPQWDGTPGKKIVVYGEQGLGDEIMFASMLPEIIEDNTVIFECHRRLKTLFETSFPGLVCIGTREDTEITWPGEYELDARISIGSLGKLLRRSRDKFPGTPYLKAEPLPKGPKFRVGISWTGGLKAGRIAARTIPLAWWKSILDVANVEFVSLQYTDCEKEIAAMNAQGYDIKQMPEAKADDYNETARLVASCDLVISCCTSVIHLAGALGVPCWVMVPNKPAWRYGVSGGMVWYRSVRLYRQPEGDASAWMPVVDMVAMSLDELVAGKQRIAA